MFWRVAGFSQPSPVETLLDKENFTLEELLDEDDLIQECKALNGRLINFLKERRTVEKLLRYLIQAPPEDNEAADPKQQFKYSFAACEVFCCEVDGIFNMLLDDDTLLDLLFSLLQQEGSLHCITAGYFARVVGTLLFRRTGDVMRYLESHQAVLQRLVAHLDTTSIAEIVVRLVGAEESSGMYVTPSQVAWLTETNLMELLLERLGPGFPADAQKHAAEIMAAVARSQMSPLIKIMATPECLRVLFERAFTCDGPLSVQALDVCIALLEPKPTGQIDQYGGYSASVVQGGLSQEARMQLQTAVVLGILPYCARLLAMLDDCDEAVEQDEVSSIPQPRLGSARLKAVETVAALVRVGNADADAAVAAAKLIPRCLHLFLLFPFNNLLHHQVTTMLMGVLEAGSPQLVAHVFEAANLLSWLLTAPVEVQLPPRPDNSASQEPRLLRAGYMGHMTYIANKLLEAAHGSSQVLAYLDACDTWQEYVEGTLTQRNVLENVMQWACGRPNDADLTGMSCEAEDAEMDGELMELKPLPQEPPVDSMCMHSAGDPPAPSQSLGEVDAESSVHQDASIAFHKLQLSPPLLGSPADTPEAQAPPVTDAIQRSASPAGAINAPAGGSSGSFESEGGDSCEGGQPSCFAAMDAAPGSHHLLVLRGGPAGESSAGAPDSVPAPDSPSEPPTAAETHALAAVVMGDTISGADEVAAGGSDVASSSRYLQDAWVPTWPAGEESATHAASTAPIAVPLRSTETSPKPSVPEVTAAAAAEAEVSAAEIFAESDGAAAPHAGAGDARSGGDKEAADVCGAAGIVSGGLAAAFAEEAQLSANEDLGRAGETRLVADNPTAQESTQLVATEPTSLAVVRNDEPCQSNVQGTVDP